MSKALKYVKEFDFGPQKTYVRGYARGGACYAEGGKADIKLKAAVHKHEKGMHPGQPLTKLARGGSVSKAPAGGGMVPDKATAALARDSRLPGVAGRRAMPVAPRTPLIQAAKGGPVPAGRAPSAKISKVMGEFKAGELHSGSKSGPVVKNPKQAVAIALSEARATKKRG
jgi:hypothetical protein